MAVSGDEIKYDNFSNSRFKDYENKITDRGKHSYYLYFSAVSCQVVIRSSGTVGTWLDFNATFCYYDYKHGWVKAGELHTYTEGKKESDSKVFYHNVNGHDDTFTGTNVFHLWRIYCECSGAGGLGGSYNRLDADVFSCGGMSREQYNAICNENTEIISAGRHGDDSFHASGSNDDATALSLFGWPQYRGNEITASTEECKLIPKSWG